ncbi:YhcH/YjgK/YiaL family protein [Dysgonomonas sp. Marseille-Q5470]|uniref:YhcH/YjgK/YiaL family protein n=1 Tax=Dysgonomonas TaxID=156973 RepID=UPI0024BC6490|nr:YhcH/YjgK/YiaL family protein [Dysgonomonas sp. Marseille-Q5470]
MILDKLENSGKYEHLHPLFKEAFDYLKSIDFSKAEPTKTELKGKDLFVMVSDSELRAADKAKPETHNKYIDIQLPISRPETFGWKARQDLTQPIGNFDEEKDIQFFDDKVETQITVLPGNFLIFFPEDGHAPCIGEGQVRKVVVKIKI